MTVGQEKAGDDRALSPELKRELKNIIDEFEREDQSTREKQLRQWKKLKFMFAGLTNLWWSETAHDWRTFDIQTSSTEMGDAGYYDKPINVFKGMIESIIAALSSTVPGLKCFPDDAQNPNDILTAKGGDKICDLVFKHNDAPLLWVHALFIYCTEGMIAAYNYCAEDKKFGTYGKKNYKKEEETRQVSTCPECNQPFTPFDVQLSNEERNEFQPDDEEVKAQDLLNKNQQVCSNCLMQVDPELKEEKFPVEKFTGITQEPKTRQIVEIYGGLNVKIANYARRQCETPYLKYSYEAHKSDALCKYEFLHDKGLDSGGTGYDIYERWARVSTQYTGEFPTSTITWHHWWLRPQAFECCKDASLRAALKARYPNGAHVVYCNDEYCESENDALDDHWTIAYNPLADYVHYEPLGMLLVSVQEIINEIISITLQTVEHGIPQTFADPEVLNFKAYAQAEVRPGDIFPAKPKTGKSISEAFYEVKTSSLSSEVKPFADNIISLGQMASGALPSLSGGDQPNSSKTAAQYSMSKAQALQRLQTPWKMLTFWWKNIFSKVIPQYIKDMKDDEKWTVKGNTPGEFINVVVKRAEMMGKLGDIELESTDQIPMSWAQQKDVIMQLMNLNNPMIMGALSDPENVELLANAIGLNNFEIPGEEDRTKQYEEITLLLQGKPTQDPQTGHQIPTIDVEPLVDNHDIEANICRRWLVSEAGRQCKTDNPGGYQNVLAHMSRHLTAAQMLAQAFGGGNQPQPKPDQNPNQAKQKVVNPSETSNV